MDYYSKIKDKLIDNEIYVKAKDYSKENHTVITYYEVGKLLFDAGKQYGENIVGNYSKKLQIEVGQKYNERTLRRMRQLYLFFEQQKWSPVGTKLSISHIRELFCLNDSIEINYYVEQASKRNLSKRELANIIKNKEYERLPQDTKKKLIDKKESDIIDFVKNPIMIRNINNYEFISEKILKKLILENIESFMKELGNFFCFIGSEYKIKIGNQFNYIDILLYNIKYKCYVVIELKVTKLRKEYIGQINTYMNYIDKNLRTIDENRTIGIIIVKKDNKFIMEYCSDDRIVCKEYIIV